MASLALVIRNPLEAADRAVNKVEEALDRQPPRPLDSTGRPSRAQVREHALEHWGYRTSSEWTADLERLLGASPATGFEEVWEAVGRDVGDAGGGLDADKRLASAVWSVVRAVRPERFVETGVSRGILTRVILEAMERNGSGHLWSIDLPPQQVRWRDQTRAAVPERLHARWTFLRGSSRRHLPRLLADLGAIDVFLHDSQHTRRNMAFEMRRALKRLRPGGVLIGDDIHENSAWRDVVADHPAMIAQEERKAGLFGVLVTRGG